MEMDSKEGLKFKSLVESLTAVSITKNKNGFIFGKETNRRNDVVIRASAS